MMMHFIKWVKLGVNILIVKFIIMCFNNFPFCSQLLLGQLLFCFNDYYVLKITDILVSPFCKII